MVVFTLFLLLLHPLLFLSAQILSGRVLGNAGQIVLNLGIWVDMDEKLCKRISKFKMSDSKAGPWARPKQPKFCPDYLLLTSEVIV